MRRIKVDIIYGLVTFIAVFIAFVIIWALDDKYK
nr:MAG TPA: hypothetical protein [Caudoviricetes sp.]